MSHGIGVPKTQGPIPPNATSLLGIPRLLLYYPESYTSLCKVLGNWTVGTVYPKGAEFKIQRVGAGSSLECERRVL